MTIQLVTHCTQHYLERMRPYLDSLRPRWPYTVHLLTVEFDAPGEFQRAYPQVQMQRVPKVLGSPENTDSLQHGAFIDYVPGAAGDLLIYTDGDIVMQRAPRFAEIQALESLTPRAVACGWNSGPAETLAIEGGRLFPRRNPAEVFGEMVYHTSCYNIGVIAARRSTWHALWAAYMARWDDALAVFGAQQRQQWLVCWAIESLGLEVQVMPYSVHMHGCYPLPEGASNAADGSGVTYQGGLVLFRHHL